MTTVHSAFQILAIAFGDGVGTMASIAIGPALCLVLVYSERSTRIDKVQALILAMISLACLITMPIVSGHSVTAAGYDILTFYGGMAWFFTMLVYGIVMNISIFTTAWAMKLNLLRCTS